VVGGFCFSSGESGRLIVSLYRSRHAGNNPRPNFISPEEVSEMLRQMFLVAVSAVALALWISPSTFAADESHDGTVVAVADGKVTMTATGSKDEHSHAVAADAKITLNGKEARLTDLKKGDKIKVTMGADKKATKIEARRS
jgi:hypothetical protein